MNRLNRLVDLAPCIVVFIFYTNAAVVGVKYHGVPFIAASSYLLLLLVPIGRDVLFRGKSLRVTPALVCIVALFFVALLGVFFAIRPERSAEALQELALEGILLYFLFLNAIRTPAVLKQVVWALIAAGIFMGALVSFQQFTGAYESEFLGFAQVSDGRGFKVDDVVAESPSRQRRLAGPIGEPNRFAQIMTVLVPLAALQIYASRRKGAKLLAFAGLLVILLGGSLAFSRGAAVGLALMVLVMVSMGYVKLRHLAAMAVALVIMALLVPQYGRRLVSLGEVATLATQVDGAGMANADGSTRGRLTEMFTAVMVFADHPIIGAGPDMYGEHYVEYAQVAGGKMGKVRLERRQAHSLPLQIAAEHGILGLTAFGMALFFTFRELGRARRHWLQPRPDLAHITAGLQLALVVYLTTSLFLHMSYARYFWFIFAAAGAAAQMATEEESGWVLERLRPSTGAARSPT